MKGCCGYFEPLSRVYMGFNHVYIIFNVIKRALKCLPLVQETFIMLSRITFGCVNLNRTRLEKCMWLTLARKVLKIVFLNGFCGFNQYAKDPFRMHSFMFNYQITLCEH